MTAIVLLLLLSGMIFAGPLHYKDVASGSGAPGHIEEEVSGHWERNEGKSDGDHVVISNVSVQRICDDEDECHGGESGIDDYSGASGGSGGDIESGEPVTKWSTDKPTTATSSVKLSSKQETTANKGGSSTESVFSHGKPTIHGNHLANGNEIESANNVNGDVNSNFIGFDRFRLALKDTLKKIYKEH